MTLKPVLLHRQIEFNPYHPVPVNYRSSNNFRRMVRCCTTKSPFATERSNNKKTQSSLCLKWLKVTPLGIKPFLCSLSCSILNCHPQHLNIKRKSMLRTVAPQNNCTPKHRKVKPLSTTTTTPHTFHCKGVRLVGWFGTRLSSAVRAVKIFGIESAFQLLQACFSDDRITAKPFHFPG